MERIINYRDIPTLRINSWNTQKFMDIPGILKLLSLVGAATSRPEGIESELWKRNTQARSFPGLSQNSKMSKKNNVIANQRASLSNGWNICYNKAKSAVK